MIDFQNSLTNAGSGGSAGTCPDLLASGCPDTFELLGPQPLGIVAFPLREKPLCGQPVLGFVLRQTAGFLGALPLVE
ncbi:hypothetical protein [Actinacidiphila oryziradicis]|uniref:Uncharacterized protein n=1 Tax=Actinacidiphila oryziradicis TaxID=2571141 RepID=A0A4U0SAI4_9ACTN|nr:hypothetical protein [Actinacidiphila oryziradicis]TKA06330.1 hypothetical protein FCI23_32290 [Actinacidiphila oryziradicis]